MQLARKRWHNLRARSATAGGAQQHTARGNACTHTHQQLKKKRTDERLHILRLLVDVKAAAGAERVRERRVELAQVVEDLGLLWRLIR